MTVINWCLANWEIVTGAAIALLSLINALTGHYDSASGVRRVLLFALDAISAWQSGQSAVGEGSARGLPVKVPLLQMSPPQDRIARRVAEIKESRRG